MKFNLIIAAIMAVLLASCGVYSEGERSGQVTKISQKGIIFKTSEGELVMSGMRKSSDSDGNTSIVANVFKYSVTDPGLVQKLTDAARSGTPVTLVYDQFLIPSPTHRKTEYIIRDVISE